MKNHKTSILSTVLRVTFCTVALAALTGASYAQDNFAIYKYTESTRGKYMRSQGAEGGIERTANKMRRYIVLNLDTGEFQRLSYYSDIVVDGAGRRTRVKEYRTEFADYRPVSFFPTAFGVANNHLVLSMSGTGDGQNYYFNGDVFGGDKETAVSTDTMVGRIRSHRIGTGASRVDLVAPAKFIGTTSTEREAFRAATDLTRRTFSNGKQSMVLQKRLTADALADGSLTIEDALVFVTEFLQGKGYIDHEAHDVD